MSAISHAILFTCEAAMTGDDGKLSVSGIYNEFYSPGFPAKQDEVVLAGMIEWQRDTDGEQVFRIHLVDPNDRPIFSIEGRSTVDARADDRAPAKTHLIFPLEDLVFVTPGRYRIVLELGEERMETSSLYLLPATGQGDSMHL